MLLHTLNVYPIIRKRFVRKLYFAICRVNKTTAKISSAPSCRLKWSRDCTHKFAPATAVECHLTKQRIIYPLASLYFCTHGNQPPIIRVYTSYQDLNGANNVICQPSTKALTTNTHYILSCNTTIDHVTIRP